MQSAKTSLKITPMSNRPQVYTHNDTPVAFSFVPWPKPLIEEGFAKYTHAVECVGVLNQRAELVPVVRTIGYVAIGKFPDNEETIVWTAFADHENLDTLEKLNPGLTLGLRKALAHRRGKRHIRDNMPEFHSSPEHDVATV